MSSHPTQTVDATMIETKIDKRPKCVGRAKESRN
jgi:hypothetical protein